MRIIAGRYRGRNLYSPADEKVRPTTDRIKETVFNILQFRVPGAKVLDLFSGSGALGIECISRGAEEVIFADKAQASLDLTAKNLKGIEGNYKIVPGDFLSVLRSLHGRKFDIIFLDPPYDGMLGEIAADAIAGTDMLADGGVIYFEHGSDKKFVPPTGYKTRTKPMGYTVAEFVTKKTVAMVTGSFDPITRGHEAIIEEAAAKYDEVVVALLVNPDKKYYFTPEERLEIVKAAISNMKGVRAIYSESTAVDTAKAEGASVFVRGIRDDADREYEEKMREYNLDLGIDTVIFDAGLSCISSTRAREEIEKGDFSSLPKDAIITVQRILAEKKRV